MSARLTIQSTQPLTAAQWDLVEANRALLGWACRRFAWDCPRNEREDLLDRLFDGLVRAAQTYDPGRGTRFSSHAAWWLRAGVIKWRISRKHRFPLLGDVERSIRFRLDDPISEEPDGLTRELSREETARLRRLTRTCKRLVGAQAWAVLVLRRHLSINQVAERLSLTREEVRWLIVRSRRQLAPLTHLLEPTS